GAVHGAVLELPRPRAHGCETMFRRGVLALLLTTCACNAGGDGGDASGLHAFAGAPSRPAPVDTDRDGLCDSREQELGTDPESKDRDAAGLPDLPEPVNGFDPTNPNAPAGDQLGYLTARVGASIDFPIRATIDGGGENVSGIFQSLPSLDPDGFDAGDFFR